MLSWFLALLLASIAFSLAAAYLWLVKRRRTEMKLGLQALAGLRWREFSELVRRALREQRGLREVEAEPGGPLGPRTEFLMTNDSGSWLVSCKHGLAYRIGTSAINELGATARLSGARGGILITEGRVNNEGLGHAVKQAVEVLDGPRLWQLLLPYVPGDIESQVRRSARHEASRRTLIAAFAASTLGLLAGMGYQTSLMEPAPGPTVGRPAVDRATLPPRAPPATAPDAPPATPGTEAVVEDFNPDPQALEHYQQELSRALSKLPGVASGIWQTRQTLAINRTGELDSIWPLICGEVVRYPALRTVRIQINARPGVDEPVRWRQCATL